MLILIYWREKMSAYEDELKILIEEYDKGNITIKEYNKLLKDIESELE